MSLECKRAGIVRCRRSADPENWEPKCLPIKLGSKRQQIKADESKEL